jgi:hypothetical protein
MGLGAPNPVEQSAFGVQRSDRAAWFDEAGGLTGLWVRRMLAALGWLSGFESGILLASISAVLLNLYFNGGKGDDAAAIQAAKQADAH